MTLPKINWSKIGETLSQHSSEIIGGITAVTGVIGAFNGNAQAPSVAPPEPGTGQIANWLNGQLAGFNNPLNYKQETQTVSNSLMWVGGLIAAVLIIVTFLKPNK